MAINTLNIESKLLHRMGAGEQDAFKLIYNKFHESVYTFSIWYLKSEVEADEVVTRNRSLDILRKRVREAKADVALTINWQENHTSVGD